MIHTSITQNCTVFFLRRELSRSAIYGSQIFDSHKWPTVLVDEVKGKPCIFEACLCGSLYSTFTRSFYPYAFYNKRLQTLFKDQLDRSKATCSFKSEVLRAYTQSTRKLVGAESGPQVADSKRKTERWVATRTTITDLTSDFLLLLLCMNHISFGMIISVWLTSKGC